MLRQNLSQKEIAKRLGCSEANVSQVVKRIKLPGQKA